MKVLYIETFYGGSHRYFADRWIAASRHDFDMKTLPARHWKWRQAGSALRLAGDLPAGLDRRYGAAVVSGMTDLAQLKALRPDLPPVMLYVHENQFAYPLAEGESRDFRYGLTDLSNICCAELTAFNSRFNLNSFLDSCRDLFSRLPDAVPRWCLDEAERRSCIAPPGIDAAPLLDPASPPPAVYPGSADPEAPPLIIWNHRHEHDKDPDAFFRVLEALARDGFPFSLVLLGERFRRVPPAFERGRLALRDRIVFDGYPCRSEYLQWLKAGDIVISTARQENFGLAVVEAIAAGCRPLLPDRLAYPEVIPRAFHDSCLWNDEADLYRRLAGLITAGRPGLHSGTEPLRKLMERYDWPRCAAELDGLLDETAAARGF